MRKKKMFRVLSAVLCSAVLAGLMLTGCGDKADQTEPPATDGETTEATTVETKREVTTVGKQMRHMTYNIAGSNGLERIPNFDLNETKKANIKQIIEEIDPDTFGVQEAPRAWIEGLPELLDGKYACAGSGSDQGQNEKFWFNPIYYKVDTFNCLDEGVLFLDEGFVKNKNNRNCSYALLERIEDGELVLIVSLHLEHRALGTEDLETYNYQNYYEKTSDRNLLRDAQIGYLTQIVTMKREEYASYGKEITVIVSGDFNINYWQDEAYEHEYSRTLETMGGVGLYDSVNVAANVVTNQTRAQWQTYRDYFTDDTPNARLDYIFVSDNVVVDTYTVYDTTADVGDSSDHHPTYTDYYIGH